MTFVFAGVQLSVTRVAPTGTPAEAEREFRWQRMFSQVERSRCEALAKAQLDSSSYNLR